MTPLQARTLTPTPTDSLSGVDSLFAADVDVPAHAVPTADSLLVATDSAGAAAVPALRGDDTLWYRRIAAETSGGVERFPLPTSSVHYRTAGAVEVFGPLSRTVPPHISEVRVRHPLTDNAVFQGLVLLLAAIYGLLLARRLQHIVTLPEAFARNRTSAERLVDEQLGYNIDRLRRFGALLGLCLVGMVAVRSVELLLPDAMPDTLPAALIPFAGPAYWIGATFVVALVGGYQALVLMLAGALTLTRPFVGQLLHLRRRLFVSLLLVFAPALLFFVVAPPGTERLWCTVAVAVSVITSVVYVVGSLHLFLVKKISILYWFLYLCTVEVFPLSLLWLLAGRGLW